MGIAGENLAVCIEEEFGGVPHGLVQDGALICLMVLSLAAFPVSVLVSALGMLRPRSRACRLLHPGQLRDHHVRRDCAHDIQERAQLAQGHCEGVRDDPHRALREQG